MLKSLFDNTESNSLANRFRRNRLKIFEKLISDLPRPVRIVDLGGTENYWLQMGYLNKNEFRITIVNTEEIPVSGNNIRFIRADTRNLSNVILENCDVIFSNSVLEHVGGIENKIKMAEGIKKLNKRYFVQTPNYFFPVEPHFLFPCFQFLPRWAKLFLVMNFDMGWYRKCSVKKEAFELIDSIHLLTISEVRKLFPNASIYKERFCGLIKSITAYETNPSHNQDSI